MATIEVAEFCRRQDRMIILQRSTPASSKNDFGRKPIRTSWRARFHRFVVVLVGERNAVIILSRWLSDGSAQTGVLSGRERKHNRLDLANRQRPSSVPRKPSTPALGCVEVIQTNLLDEYRFDPADVLFHIYSRLL
jgi:hypothetical protein